MKRDLIKLKRSSIYHHNLNLNYIHNFPFHSDYVWYFWSYWPFTNLRVYNLFPMPTLHLCDDCKKEITHDSVIRIWTPFDFPLSTLILCRNCFAKHWKPLRGKFSLTKKRDKPSTKLFNWLKIFTFQSALVPPLRRTIFTQNKIHPSSQSGQAHGFRFRIKTIVNGPTDTSLLTF